MVGFLGCDYPAAPPAFPTLADVFLDHIQSDNQDHTYARDLRQAAQTPESASFDMPSWQSLHAQPSADTPPSDRQDGEDRFEHGLQFRACDALYTLSRAQLLDRLPSPAAAILRSASGPAYPGGLRLFRHVLISAYQTETSFLPCAVAWDVPSRPLQTDAVAVAPAKAFWTTAATTAQPAPSVAG